MPGEIVLGLAALVVGISVLFRLQTLENRLARLNTDMDRLMRHLQVGSGITASDTVQRLAEDPKSFIAAIQAYRQETGAGLKEAKEAVERLTGKRG